MMGNTEKQAIVVGAGVIGLTTALRLLEAGWQVEIMARAFSPHTTSDVAAAVWLPYKAYPPEKVLAWSRRSFEVYETLAEVPEAGITFTPLTLLSLERARVLPFWASAVRDARRLRAEEVPPGFVEGIAATVPVVETPLFVPWLMREVEQRGAIFREEDVTDLTTLFARTPVVVNCSGLGARTLAADDTVFPIRGQIVRLARTNGVPCVCVDDGPLAPAYVIPRRDDVVCGGTAQEYATSITPTEADAASILERCHILVPALTDAPVLEHRVGLRPGRSAVRLAAERQAGGVLVHNYGHGGSGYTLCWGCAEEVSSMLESGSEGAKSRRKML